MSTATVNNLIDEFIHLPLDDKEYATEVIKKQLVEAKRDAIAKRAKTAVAGFRKKIIKCGTVKELYKDLESD
jgi:hypothetical protein